MASLALVRRQVVLYDVEDIRKELGDQALKGVQVYIDKNNETDIRAMLATNAKKSRRAIALAMQGIYNKDLYGKEEVSSKASNVTAIKHKGKINNRIYCQELFLDSKKIILITPYHKKGYTISKQNKTVIEAAGNHTFDLKVK